MFRRLKFILVLVFLLLIFFLSLPLSISQQIKSSIISISYPLLKTSAYLARKLSSFKELTGEMFTVSKQNEELHRELKAVKNELNQNKEALLENQRLRKLLELKTSLRYESIACMVIGRDASTWFKSLIIDKGTESGIKPFMPVINKDGVVGRIISCRRETATVLLVTDVNSSIGGMLQNNRVVGVLEGQGTSECILNYISKKENVPIGATVVTSGLGSVFPKGLIIGKVKNIKIDSQNLYKIAEVSLSADLEKIEEVLVIKAEGNR